MSVDTELIKEILLDYAQALRTGELDGAGRYIPAVVEDEAFALTEVEELRRDAERYRFLKQQILLERIPGDALCIGDDPRDSTDVRLTIILNPESGITEDSEVGAAIDVAMAQYTD